MSISEFQLFEYLKVMFLLRFSLDNGLSLSKMVSISISLRRLCYGHAYRQASEALIQRLNSCFNFVNYLSTRGLRWLVFFCYHLAEQVLIFFTCYRIAIQTYPLWSETSKSWKYLSMDWVNVLRKIAMFATKVRHEYCCWLLPPPPSPSPQDHPSCLSPSPAEK